jgi:aerotaxis receptor
MVMERICLMERPAPVDEQYTFKDGVIVSDTDLKGIITYSNRKFCEIAGYHKSELIGKNHNIVRHPDMPKAAFKELWETLQKGESWTGTVKNLRKDGRYYWVYTYIAPIIKEGEITGYSAARKPATSTEIEEAEELYERLFREEN